MTGTPGDGPTEVDQAQSGAESPEWIDVGDEYDELDVLAIQTQTESGDPGPVKFTTDRRGEWITMWDPVDLKKLE